MDIGNLLAKTSDDISVRRAFGAAYEKDGVLIIPVAIVVGGGGGGTSRGRRGPESSQEDAGRAAQGAVPRDAVPPDSGPVDAGGGFGGLVLPSGAYVVKGDRVRWVPAVDVTIVVRATLTRARILARASTRRRKTVRG